MTDTTLNSYAATVASGERRRKRAVLYLRVSTPGQVNTDYNPEGISIPAQREAGLRKAESLESDVVREFVEPGRSATSIDKRPSFQEMIAWVKAQKDIDYVIVYHFNRVFRDSVDAGITKRDLKKYSTRIVSTILDMGETPESAMVETILHAVDQYQSQASGADIAYKMGQKAKNGGTIGRAPLGYLNVFDHFEDRQIRTVDFDPIRAPLVKQAFELYASDRYTLADLSDELYDRGLITKATARHPSQPVSISKLSQMLRDRYYIGYLTYKGQEVKGRHQPLIDDDLFDRVQTILKSRTEAQERRRVHHHYLKGSLFCGRCHRAGRTSRMLIQRTKNRWGTEYLYFFCASKRDKKQTTCPTPHVSVQHVEELVEQHYATVRFDPGFAAEVRAQLTTMLNDDNAASRLFHQQLTKELQALDVQESNLLDLSDGDLPDSAAAKIKRKLHDIDRRRQHLTERLGTTNDELSVSAQLIETCLTLLADPQELYRRCDDHQRRLLNQALFHAFYIEDDEISDSDLKEPFAQLHDLQRRRARVVSRDVDEARNGSRAASRWEDDPASNELQALLPGIDLARGCSKAPNVELRGIEPLTFSMRTGGHKITEG
ncbi:MAG TPA: recombinase family protein [Pseudonocardiaceae bacterium]|jgi:DNA invertase Pin-like site-specific DNA recombinase|nr:recombinase family protein [Pseudonocardiaceae bacterium]